MTLADTVAVQRRARDRQRNRVVGLLAALLLAGFCLALMRGQSWTPPMAVIRALTGQEPAFAVSELRLPRAVMAILAGLCFGLGGAAFQTMLRNPLASPDIIGISFGSSAAAVFAIVVLSLGGPVVSAIAVVCGLGVALLIYALSYRGGVAGTRLILVGIGVSAMLQSFIAYTLSRAPSWSAQEATRWLTGSVNGAQLDQAALVLAALVVFGGILLAKRRDLETLRMGDDTAQALGVGLARTRITVIVTAVGLIAFATAATGPISFIAFLSGPIAARIAGRNRSILVPAALVGAALALFGDYAGQFLMPGRYPVGVVTGVLGAPYLLYLIVRANRTGGSL